MLLEMGHIWHLRFSSQTKTHCLKKELSFQKAGYGPEDWLNKDLVNTP